MPRAQGSIGPLWPLGGSVTLRQGPRPIATRTGCSGSQTETDIVFTPNGNAILPGPASEYACEIPSPTSEECLPMAR